MNLTVLLQVAQFIVWLVLNLPKLVQAAEELIPESNRGGEKFAAVKDAVLVGAKVAGMADAAIKAVGPLVDERINRTVDSTINSSRQSTVASGH